MSSGEDRFRVQLEAPGPPVPDGDGGYTEGFQPLEKPDWQCSIQPATVRELEALGAGTILAQATHIVRGRYHAGITTKARLKFRGRILNVLKVVNLDERNIRTHLVCAEVIE